MPSDPVEQPKKHTPGPWNVERDNRDFHGERFLRAPDGSALMCDMQYYPWTPDSDADWNLIAAAPEMLEALKDLFAATLNEMTVRGLPHEWSPTSAMARAKVAIQKAEGVIEQLTRDTFERVPTQR